jgi:hypothetical protein
MDDAAAARKRARTGRRRRFSSVLTVSTANNDAKATIRKSMTMARKSP